MPRTIAVMGSIREAAIALRLGIKWVQEIIRVSRLLRERCLLGQRLSRDNSTVGVSCGGQGEGSRLGLVAFRINSCSVAVQVRLRDGGWLRMRVLCQRVGRVMRGQGRVRAGALNRLLSGNSGSLARLRDAASNIITTSDKTRVFPLALGGGSVTQVGRILWHRRVIVYSVGMVWVRLVLSAFGTVQDASTDSGGAWSSTGSSSVILSVGVSGSANFRHAVRFSRGRKCDRILVVCISVAVTASIVGARAISVVVKVGVVGSGSSFRSGKRDVLVEFLRAPTADNRRDDEDQYTESYKSNHAKCTGDSTSVVEETFAIALHDAGG